jgi:hypothetical protein
MRRFRSVLSWALALSWVPLFAFGLAVPFLGHPQLGGAFVIIGVLWVLKLCDMFDLFQPPPPHNSHENPLS